MHFDLKQSCGPDAIVTSVNREKLDRRIRRPRMSVLNYESPRTHKLIRSDGVVS